ncbi:MAG: hypothetical protein KAI29_08805 [Cyclobacteriaceae bacterium]|nr:hypothetical protein [Cyclobacteriaceae bacterium]
MYNINPDYLILKSGLALLNYDDQFEYKSIEMWSFLVLLSYLSLLVGSLSLHENESEIEKMDPINFHQSGPFVISHGNP